ncbi:hypothetical protein HMN09_00610500 [Mycena chlorophos]|uniref:CBM1 domain-containing protein n=1 Tax=Mycena chlorophos TaxID=658473 RepID=A0A8H6T5M6_MYCCL|nr:hypothetical protein HMN09_00610500 [Mycena chlorophos]
MPSLSSLVVFAVAAAQLVSAASQAYTWNNVRIGGGGGFVPGIVFNPSEKGLAFARCDIGGAYKLNSDDTWTPLLDWVDNAQWAYWGVAALATDPVDTNRLYLVRLGTTFPNSANNLIGCCTWTVSPLSFKVGGNMPGRGMGERLAVDPNLNSILYFGAGAGKGLWKSTNYGETWTQVTNFPSVGTPGTYAPDPTDSTGYNSELIGLAWVTFDSTSGTSGTATPRIFVGVANLGSTNIYYTENAGETWAAVPGQNSTYMPHKGVLSPKEKLLYVTYSNGAGPYDGTLGAVAKYNITSSTWTDITPDVDSSLGGPLYYGFGGLAVDLQTPGVLMVAALNSWWPNGQMAMITLEELDSSIQEKRGRPSGIGHPNSTNNIEQYYTYSDSLAPWIGVNGDVNDPGLLQVGWMIEALVIDPFDSNHWLYGTGETIYGGHNLLTWDTTHNVSISSLAEGIEETSVQALISPPGGAPLISALGDIQGFVHTSLTTPPPLSAVWTDPQWSTTADLDYAGLSPSTIVRIGTNDSSLQVALSNTGGSSWSIDYGASQVAEGGHVAISASGDTVLWSTNGQGVLVSQYTSAFSLVSSLPTGAVIASDKVNDSVFYGAYSSSFYVSTDGGKTFKVTASLLDSSSPQKIVVHPNVTGDVWVTSDVGLFHSTNTGSTFTQISSVTEAWQMDLGVPQTSGGYPAVYIAAEIGGVVGYYRSDTEGSSWVQINDAAHGFGSAASNPIAADHSTYGRVYIGTNGRGIFYGDIAGSVTSTTTSSSSTTSKTSSTTTSSKTTTTSSSKTTSSTTTSKSSSTTSSTSTSSAPSGTATAYAQCGGQGWTGPTACVSGYTCVVQNPYYSQCVPS